MSSRMLLGAVMLFVVGGCSASDDDSVVGSLETAEETTKKPVVELPSSTPAAVAREPEERQPDQQTTRKRPISRGPQTLADLVPLEHANAGTDDPFFADATSPDADLDEEPFSASSKSKATPVNDALFSDAGTNVRNNDDLFFADAEPAKPKNDNDLFFADAEDTAAPSLGDDPFFDMSDHGAIDTGDDPFFAESPEDAEPYESSVPAIVGSDNVVESRSADPADMPFELPYYPPHYSVAGKPFRSPPIKMPRGSPEVTWELKNARSDMTIDPQTGSVTWLTADVKDRFITLLARSEHGAQYMNWPHKAIETGFDDVDLYRSRYFIYIAKPQYIRVMREYNVAQHLDTGWRYYADVVGCEPNALQAVLYVPTQGGLGLSGNPVKAGPVWWKDRPERIQKHSLYEMGCWHHEAGHNFMFQLRSTWFKGSYFQGWWHHGCECIQWLKNYRTLSEPAQFGVIGNGLPEFRQSAQRKLAGQRDEVKKFVASGKTIREFQGKPYAIWGGIVYGLLERFGPAPVEGLLRSLRPDGLPDVVFTQVVQSGARKGISPVDARLNLLVAILSQGAQQDLSDEFLKLGFPIRPDLYKEFRQLVDNNWHHVPPNDTLGWSQCPVNGKWYRLTRWNMTWQQAEQHARLAGGHLATITSKEQEDWLLRRYQKPGLFWIGLRDKTGRGDWAWTSGEPLTYTGWRTGNPENPAHQVVLLAPKGWNDTSHYRKDSWLRRGLVEADKPVDAWKY